MGSKTGISWTTSTWNPVVGCSHVSPGCEHCYAETLALRRHWTPKTWKAQFAAENVILKPERLDQPLRWREPRRVFVNSMSDLFHEQIPFEYVAQVFGVMAMACGHVFQVLTKRPERLRQFFAWIESRELPRPVAFRSIRVLDRDPKPSVFAIQAAEHLTAARWEGWPAWPLPNVWLGVSVEDQRRADERIPLLLQTPAAVRFLSCEPLLAPLNLLHCDGYNALTGTYTHYHDDTGELCDHDDLPGVDWIIVGGESGPHYRPMDLDWARSLRDQCRAAGVAFFYKQGSGPRPGQNATLDGVEWHQFPDQANA